MLTRKHQWSRPLHVGSMRHDQCIHCHVNRVTIWRSRGQDITYNGRAGAEPPCDAVTRALSDAPLDDEPVTDSDRAALRGRGC